MKSKLVTFLLCTFLGNLGIHRFYLGKVGTGLLYMFTLGFCGVGTFIDTIKIASNTLKDKSGMDLNDDVPSAVVWLVVGLYIFFFVIGFGSGIFSVSEKVVNEVPPVPLVEKPVQVPEKQPVEQTVEQPVEQPIVEKPTVNSYKTVTVKSLYKELNENALRAEKTYQDAYVEVSGYLMSIDSDGAYFTIVGSRDTFDFETILCRINNDDVIDKLINFNEKDNITVYGQVTTIGEIMGYTVEVIDIK